MSAPFIDEFRVGQEAPELRHVLRRTDLVRYAGASGDFNPMHHDEILAVGAGQPSVFGHGMLSMGFLATAITKFVGIGRLVDYSVRFSRQTWPNEELITHVTVAALREESGETLVDLDVSLTNAEGETKVIGTATAAVPSRS
jgi:acyl dehydratase